MGHQIQFHLIILQQIKLNKFNLLLWLKIINSTNLIYPHQTTIKLSSYFPQKKRVPRAEPLQKIKKSMRDLHCLLLLHLHLIQILAKLASNSLTTIWPNSKHLVASLVRNKGLHSFPKEIDPYLIAHNKKRLERIR